MNSMIQVAGDFYLYHISKGLIGKRGALIALVFCLLNYRMSEIFSKTLTNGAEAVCSLIAFYYY